MSQYRPWVHINEANIAHSVPIVADTPPRVSFISERFAIICLFKTSFLFVFISSKILNVDDFVELPANAYAILVFCGAIVGNFHHGVVGRAVVRWGIAANDGVQV